jgi:DNA-binding transcriptional LysR family regulator
MELRQLRYVVAVAETANFTRAAERCFVVQSALSQQIRRLEDELGARLFERTSRSVCTTAAGEAFVAVARRMLADADRARAEVAAVTGQIRGRLAIGKMQSVPGLDIALLLAAFHARHPDVDLSLREDLTDRMVRDVRTGRLDLALVARPGGDPPDGMNHLEVRTEGHVAIVAHGHALAALDTVGLGRLAEEVFVDFAPGAGGRPQIDDAFRTAGLTRRVGFEVTSLKGLARLVELGLAVALVPATVAGELGDRHHRVTVPDAPVRSVYLVWSEHPAPAVRAFADIVAGHLDGPS